MKIKTSYSIKLSFNFLLTFYFLTLQNFNCHAQETCLKLHIRGIVETKISLLPLTGPNALKPIIVKTRIKNGETDSIIISNVILPGEFVLRFEYKDKKNSIPYPCEKQIIIYNQNLELWVNPMHCNNNDSTYFQKEEKENTLLFNFNKENSKQKEKLGLLHNFLLNYDDTQSVFYQNGIEEHEKRRNQYNHWLTEQSTYHKNLFVSHVFQFQYVPKIDFNGSESDRMQNLLSHYFEGIDFGDTMLLKTQELKRFITTYVNMYASIAKTQAELDSLYPIIGKTAIENAKHGSPLLYGWMVDYFYNGYESMNMPAGIKMLDPYLNDSNCLTTKQKAIKKRLAGMETLKIGTLAPNFILKDDAGKKVLFNKYKNKSRYKLLLFYSADCEHCKDLENDLYSWWKQLKNKTLVEIFALSIDETEIATWQKAITKLPGWKHIKCDGGVNSAEAKAYFILSTPVMFLIDAKTNKICAFPENKQQLLEQIALQDEK